jgi:DNA-binding transcriptional MerR regulator
VSSTPVAPKEYYSIGEVCSLVGLKPHVLRYWEGQFPALNPSKNRSGNRVYLRREIELILLVKQLLHQEKYTIEGARRKLNQLRRAGELPAATALAVDSELLLELHEDLKLVLELLRVDTPVP